MHTRWIERLALLALTLPVLVSAADDPWAFLGPSKALLEQVRKEPVPQWLQGSGNPYWRELAQEIGQARPVPDALKSEERTRPERTYVFVSLGMPEAELKALLSATTAPEVIAVLRGVEPGGTLLSTARRLMTLRENSGGAGAIVDPTLFERYQVDIVPTLVHVNEQVGTVRATGSVSPQWLRDRAPSNDEPIDLGNWGSTWAIAEPDLRQVIAERLNGIDWAERSRQAAERYWREREFVELPAAVADAERWIDPTVTLTQDLHRADGEILMPAGTRFNPLRAVPLSKKLVIFDGRKPAQIDWAVRAHRSQGGRSVVIATAVDRSEGWQGLEALEQRFGQRVYLLQTDLSERLQLRVVPTLVEGVGDRLRAREIGRATLEHLAAGDPN